MARPLRAVAVPPAREIRVDESAARALLSASVMLRPLALALLSTAVSLTGCAASTSPTDDATSSDQALSGVHWQAAIRCDGAVLDVNEDERRDLQFVIRDAQAIAGMQHTADVSTFPPGSVNAKGELIFAGHVDRGVFRAEDFGSALMETSGGTSKVHGFVTVAGTNPGVPGAGGGGDPSDLLIEFGEYTNWRFRNCRHAL